MAVELLRWRTIGVSCFLRMPIGALGPVKRTPLARFSQFSKTLCTFLCPTLKRPPPFSASFQQSYCGPEVRGHRKHDTSLSIFELSEKLRKCGCLPIASLGNYATWRSLVLRKVCEGTRLWAVGGGAKSENSSSGSQKEHGCCVCVRPSCCHGFACTSQSLIS